MMMMMMMMIMVIIKYLIQAYPSLRSAFRVF